MSFFIRRWKETVIFLTAYIPILLIRPGSLNADIKQYLHLDAGALLSSAPQLWNPDFGLGTVTHQNIGYLFPSGPFFWLGQSFGLEDWITQRLWYGSILVIAGLGVLSLLRRLAPEHPSHLTGALFYMLSPFVLGHITGQSALLLPFAIFPWLVLSMAAAVTKQGWRWPAVFALLVTVAGSINGSSIFFVIIGAVLWAPSAAVSEEKISWKNATKAVARTGLLTVLTQLWWMAALAVGGWHGLPILSLTETLGSTNNTTSSFEILRSLGYWFFYGRDTGGLWLSGLADPYMEKLWLLLVSFGVAGVGLIAMAFVRWRHRMYFVVITTVGLVISIGSFHYAGRSLYGFLFKKAADSSDLIFSLRNTQRAAPLVVLGLAALTAATVQSLWANKRNFALTANALIVIMIVVNLYPLWSGSLIAERFHREEIPDYWDEATEVLDEQSKETRVMEIPGIDFASYRWGHTLDPITPGLIERPYLARELLPHGDQSGANLLVAFDRSLQEGWFEPEALPEIARIFGAGDVVLRSDLEYERYRTARPQPLWNILKNPPEGLSEPQKFGEPIPNVASEARSMNDEIELGIPTNSEHPPPVAIFSVESPLDMVRARPSDSSLIISGDGEGIVSLAAAGLLNVQEGLIQYAGSADTINSTDRLVITDTNRERAERWYGMHANVGHTETESHQYLYPDASDTRIRPVQDAPSTVAEYRVENNAGEELGTAQIYATGYGNRIFLNPEFRPVNAFDGDPLTSWRIDEYGEFVTPRLELLLDTPVPISQITFTQPLVGPQNRRVRTLAVSFDHGPETLITLGEESYVEGGQTIYLEEREFQHASFYFIDGLGPPDLAGFAEIDLGIKIREVLKVPTQLLSQTNDLDHDIAVLLTRHRTNPAEPVRPDPERKIVRELDLPSERNWFLEATVRLSDWAPDELLDEMLGISNFNGQQVIAQSSERLSGDLRSRASAAIDGDPSTHWSPEFLEQEGNWISYTLPNSITFNNLELEIVADGRHSIPVEMKLSVDEAEVILNIPDIEQGSEIGYSKAVLIELPQTLEGNQITLEILKVQEVKTNNWYTGQDIVMPIAISEIGIDGLEVSPMPSTIDSGCRNDLIHIDGIPIPIRITGKTSDALNGIGLKGTLCEESINLPKGLHQIETTDGRYTGFNIDRLVMFSAVGGVAAEGWTRTASPVDAQVTVTNSSRSSLQAEIVNNNSPFWLVLGQSFNEGWVATVNGINLGSPQLVDGFANGWFVDLPESEVLDVSLKWAPQRNIWIALLISLLGVLICFYLIYQGRNEKSLNLCLNTPRLSDPRRSFHNLPVKNAVITSILLGLFAAFVSTPLVGLITTCFSLISTRYLKGRLLLTALPIVAYSVGVAYIIFLQIRWEYEPAFSWPSWGRSVHHLGLLTVLLLTSDVVLEKVSKRHIELRNKEALS